MMERSGDIEAGSTGHIYESTYEEPIVSIEELKDVPVGQAAQMYPLGHVVRPHT
jgi:hypothetical protein